jgi:hypothetical protein
MILYRTNDTHAHRVRRRELCIAKEVTKRDQPGRGGAMVGNRVQRMPTSVPTDGVCPGPSTQQDCALQPGPSESYIPRYAYLLQTWHGSTLPPRAINACGAFIA